MLGPFKKEGAPLNVFILRLIMGLELAIFERKSVFLRLLDTLYMFICC